MPFPIPVVAARDKGAEGFWQGFDELGTDLVAHPFAQHWGRISGNEDHAFGTALDLRGTNDRLVDGYRPVLLPDRDRLSSCRARL